VFSSTSIASEKKAASANIPTAPITLIISIMRFCGKVMLGSPSPPKKAMPPTTSTMTARKRSTPRRTRMLL